MGIIHGVSIQWWNDENKGLYYCRRVPLGTGALTIVGQGLPCSFLPTNIMPCDSRPSSWRGLRLNTNKHCLPIISAGKMCWPIRLPIFGASQDPQNQLAFKKLVRFRYIFALITVPTTK